MVKSNIIKSKIFIKESVYNAVPSFIKIMIALVLSGGIGRLLPSLEDKVLSLVEKSATASGISDLTVLVVLLSILAIALILLLRLDELAATCIIIVNIVVDLYLGLYFVSVIMAFMMLLIFFFAHSSRYSWIAPRALWLWVLFLLLAILPATQAIVPFDGVQYYLRVFFEGFLVFWLGTIIARDIKNVRYLFRLLAILGVFIAIVTLIQTSTGVMPFSTTNYILALQSRSNYQLGTTGISRSGAFFINPDPNGCFLAMMLLIALGLMVEDSSFLRKVFYLSLGFIILFAMLFTFSVEACLGAMEGIFVFIVLSGSKRDRILLLLLICSSIIGILVCFPAQVNELLQHANNPDELLLRSGAWQTGIRVIQAFPLTGVGLGNNVYSIRAEPYRVLLQHTILDHPHNSYMEFAALAGIPVLIVFLALLVSALKFGLQNWLRADRRSRNLLGAGIAVVIVLSFVSLSDAAWTFPPLATVGWLILGVVSSPSLMKSLGTKREKGKTVVKQSSEKKVLHV